MLAKDCGFKVIAHMMPDLPNMGIERDIEGFKEYFENPEFRKDSLQLSHEFWANFLRRNWSIMVFLYHGLIRSSIECQRCSSKKILYEPYSNLSLPVPNANSLLLPVIIN